MRKSASALNTAKRDRAEGPCVKKGGALRSRVPRGMVRSGQGRHRGDTSTGGCSETSIGAGAVMQFRAKKVPAAYRPAGLLARENAAQTVHALQGDAAAAHHAGQRVFGQD